MHMVRAAAVDFASHLNMSTGFHAIENPYFQARLGSLDEVDVGWLFMKVITGWLQVVW